MEVKDLHLEALSFTSAPTKTQIVNSLNAIHEFLGRMGGSLILDGSYSIADQPLGEMLNASIQLKRAAKMFEDGPNVAGLATPTPTPQMVGRR